MSKKKDMKKHITEKNNDVIYGVARTYTGNDPGTFLQQYTSEVSKGFEFVRPMLPIYGKLYCMDFTETEEPSLQMHRDTIAYLLLQKLPIRVFVDDYNSLYMVSTYSQSDTYQALEDIIELVLKCMN